MSWTQECCSPPSAGARFCMLVALWGRQSHKQHKSPVPMSAGGEGAGDPVIAVRSVLPVTWCSWWWWQIAEKRKTAAGHKFQSSSCSATKKTIVDMVKCKKHSCGTCDGCGVCRYCTSEITADCEEGAHVKRKRGRQAGSKNKCIMVKIRPWSYLWGLLERLLCEGENILHFCAVQW